MGTNRISDLTEEEFRTLIRETVRQALSEALEAFADRTDVDEGLQLRPDVADYLRRFMESDEQGTPLSEVISELGLNE